MKQFIAGMLCGAFLLYIAMHYHIVRTNNGTSLVPKVSNNLKDVYVDVRQYNLSDWQQHKPLAAAIMKSDQSEILEDASLASFRDSMRGLVDDLFQ